MGIMSATVNKKGDKEDKVSLIKPELYNNQSPEQSTINQNSPTPKNPLPNARFGLCRRLFLFCMGLLVILILGVTIACLFDYQQGNLGTHVNQLPRGVREFPKEVGVKVVGVLYETPKEVQAIFDSVVKQVQIWRNSTVSNTNSNSVIKSEPENMGDFKLVVDEKKDYVSKIKSGQENMGDYKLVNEKKNDVSKIKSVPENMGDFKFVVNEKKANVSNITLVEYGLTSISHFFQNVMEDVTGLFHSFGEAPEVDGSEKDRDLDSEDLVVRYMIKSNDITRQTNEGNSDHTEGEMVKKEDNDHMH